MSDILRASFLMDETMKQRGPLCYNCIVEEIEGHFCRADDIAILLFSSYIAVKLSTP